MKILVAGAFGYLGGHIADHLTREGHELVLLGRRASAEALAWAQNRRVIIADIADESSLQGCCNGIDAVVHAAAMNASDCAKDDHKALLVNGFGTRNLLEESRKYRVRRFVYLSTFHVYGNPKVSDIDESLVPEPFHNYSITHYLSELYCLKYRKTLGLETVALRISNGYGAPLLREQNCWMLVINDFCRTALEQKRIVLKSVGTQERDFVAIPDIQRAISLVLGAEHLAHNVYNLSGENSRTIQDLAGIVAEVYREKYGRPVPITFADGAAGPDISIPFRFKSTRLRELGYAPAASMKREIAAIFDFLGGTS